MRKRFLFWGGPSNSSFSGKKDVADREPLVQLRVGVAASTRFHLLDLARELDELGVAVDFYSYVPKKRAETFGLPGRCHVALLPMLFPLVAWQRLAPKLLPRTIERLMSWALNALVIIRMRPCDVFVCMSGIYLEAARYAKYRYGAAVILHRGSRHILSQSAILASVAGSQQISPFIISREFEGYALADRISVASKHVIESFAPWPEISRKLVKNAYGVDTKQFPLSANLRAMDQPTVLFVGQWSYRKGVDVLVDTIRDMPGVRLVHVGPKSDAPFPEGDNFRHYEPVPQSELYEFYQSAHVFVLPSREDGFGMVLSQALASGLSVVATECTGGPDLAQLPGFDRLVRVVAVGDAEGLRQALEEALKEVLPTRTISPITEAERQTLDWRSYGLREFQMIKETQVATRQSTFGCSK